MFTIEPGESQVTVTDPEWLRTWFPYPPCEYMMGGNVFVACQEMECDKGGRFKAEPTGGIRYQQGEKQNDDLPRAHLLIQCVPELRLVLSYLLKALYNSQTVLQTRRW